MSRHNKSGFADLTNVDVVVLALCRLNGHYKYVHTEDIAIVASELAPGRFSWKKYKDQINLEHIRVYLTDARKKEKGVLVTGSNESGWMLTERGVDYAAELSPKAAKVDLSRVVRSPEDQRKDEWIERERDRMASSDVLKQIEQFGIGSISARDAERFFKIDEYIKGPSRERKIERVVKALGRDVKVGFAVRSLADVVRGK